MPDALVTPTSDPAVVAVSRETIRLAFIAALQHLPPRQRAALILLRGAALEGRRGRRAARYEHTAVNSALQRARATLEQTERRRPGTRQLSEQDSALLSRYVDAFQRYDMDALTA